MKILMVCLGNICRSPLAEGILRHKVNNDVQVASAGTGNWHVGEAPDKRSILVAKQHGVDISQQRAQHFTPAMFDDFDLIFAMDGQNYSDLKKMAQNEEHLSKLHLFLEDALGEANDVPDPYYGGESDFVHVFQLIDDATDRLVEKYKLS
ncbi:low molecular weight protein-tyrosine-phosphatase [Vaginella massiliensis]|uniref:low molecular weight protein-tyrosine-phosphatase n=1 Tax=Vaginella massiliensis TaxID=1816680 RepID=UPI0037535A1B